MYKIEVAPIAMDELRKIIMHISKELCNSSAASALLDHIEDCYDRISYNPFVYEVCRDPHLKLKGYRHAVIKNYIMIYHVDEAIKTVNILHFVYGPRDYSKLI